MSNQSPITVSVASLQLSDEEILARLTTYENAFVERKSTGDAKDLLKTAVAFANSTPIGCPAILFYGVTDKGEPEGKANLDSLQKTVSDKLADAYPAIYHLTKVLEKNGKQFLAVLVPGSEHRPHFAGQSYVRDGSKSVAASKEQFERLIAQRTSTAAKVLEWIGKDITFRIPEGHPVLVDQRTVFGGGAWVTARVTDCNQHYVTIEFTRGGDSRSQAYPLAFIGIGYDCDANRLQLIGFPY